MASVLVVSGGSASAATYTVTQATDDGSGATSGSLSWAILSAGSCCDVIEVSPGISTITVTGASLPSLRAGVTLTAGQAVNVTGASLNGTSKLMLNGVSLPEAITVGLSGSISCEPASDLQNPGGSALSGTGSW